jgi:hypothetical protein
MLNSILVFWKEKQEMRELSHFTKWSLSAACFMTKRNFSEKVKE